LLLASLIMLTYNHLNLTKKALASLRQHTRLSDQVQLTVIDNHSSDGTPEFLRGLGWCDVVLNQQEKGIAASYNQGIRRVRARFYVTLANDVTFCPNWLEALMWCAESEAKIGIVGPSAYVDSKMWIFHVQEDGGCVGKLVEVHPSRKVEAEYIETSCMLIKDEVVQKIGLFDEGYDPFWYDDTDYCLRARAAGWKVMIYANVPVSALGDVTTGTHPQVKELRAKSRHRFVEKWGSWLRSRAQ